MDILFKDDITGELMYRCPGCGTPIEFSTPNSFDRYDCHDCRLILEYPNHSFLEVLVWYWKKRHGMLRPYPIQSSILAQNVTEIFAFCMMFEPEDVFSIFSYISLRTNADNLFPYTTCLRINNSYLVCYQ